MYICYWVERDVLFGIETVPCEYLRVETDPLKCESSPTEVLENVIFGIETDPCIIWG